MKFIITGALGHIGSFIIRDIANQHPNSEIILITGTNFQQRSPSEQAQHLNL